MLKRVKRLLYKPFSYGKDLCREVNKCGKKNDKKGHSTRRLNKGRIKLKKTRKIVKNFNYSVYNKYLDFTLCKCTFPHYTVFQRVKAEEKPYFVIKCRQNYKIQQFPPKKYDITYYRYF